MLEHVIPLIVSWLPMWRVFLVPVFALAFITVVPTIIRSFFRG